MTQRLRYTTALWILASVAISGGLIWLVYRMLAAAVDWLVGLESDIATAIIAAAATLAISLVSIAVNRHFDNRAKIKQDNRSKTIPVYEHLIGLIFSIMAAVREKKVKEREKRLVTDFAKCTEELIIWGSDDVLKAFGDYRDASLAFADDPPAGSKPDTAATLSLLEQIIKAVRQDLGHKDRQLEDGDLLRLFINFPTDRRGSS